MTKKVVILGATGSIGMSTLDILERHPNEYELWAISCYSQIDYAIQIALKFCPRLLLVQSEVHAKKAQLALDEVHPNRISVLFGNQTLLDVVQMPEVDIVVSAIVGAAGLEPTMAALKASKKVLLANKESLVMAGHLMIDACQKFKASLLPLDSEHNAIFQCWPNHLSDDQARRQISSITLTASGGPFLNRPKSQWASVTPEQACAHPKWKMGKKISVDSATMMNKGLEVIEAKWLFNLSVDEIDVVIHPQSIIHSLVHFVDGSSLAQLGEPDMRVPIAYALSYPNRIASGVKKLNLPKLATMDFFEPDLQTFKCLDLAFYALKQKGNAAIVLNAANESAVQAFLDGQIRFDQIEVINEQAIQFFESGLPSSIEDSIALDTEARSWVSQKVPQLHSL